MTRTRPSKAAAAAYLTQRKPTSWRNQDGRLKHSLVDAWMSAVEAVAQSARGAAFLPDTSHLPTPPDL